MNIKKIKNCTILTAAVTAVAYSAVAGKGIFNKIRFRQQHEELGKYIDNNYPDCVYTHVTMHGRGWASSVRRRGKVVSFIYFTKSPDGIYVFTESKTKL